MLEQEGYPRLGIWTVRAVYRQIFNAVSETHAITGSPPRLRILGKPPVRHIKRIFDRHRIAVDRGDLHPLVLHPAVSRWIADVLRANVQDCTNEGLAVVCRIIK